MKNMFHDEVAKTFLELRHVLLDINVYCKYIFENLERQNILEHITIRRIKNKL